MAAFCIVPRIAQWLFSEEDLIFTERPSQGDARQFAEMASLGFILCYLLDLVLVLALLILFGLACWFFCGCGSAR